METVGAFEAKTHFSALLERVSQGETITITRHGAPVARLVPISSAANRAKRLELVERIKAFSQRNTLGGLSLQELRDEGRK